MYDPTLRLKCIFSNAEVEEESISSHHRDNVQKKIMPWKLELMESETSVNSLKRDNILSLQKNEGLIVVASLIDRAPNLGGMSLGILADTSYDLIILRMWRAVPGDVIGIVKIGFDAFQVCAAHVKCLE